MVDQATAEYIEKSIRAGLSFDDIQKNFLAAGWSLAQAQEAVRSSRQTGTPQSQFATEKKQKKVNPNSPFSNILMVVLLVSLIVLAQNGLIDILDQFVPHNIGFYQSSVYMDFQAANPYGIEIGRTKEYMMRLEAVEQDYNQKRDAGATRRLLVVAALVLPFWLLTVGLSIALKEQYEKYRVLLSPYYLTSGWLLVYLLFNVSKYILNKNTTIGVYIVLLMLVAVLTVAIFAFQRYSHRSQSIKQQDAHDS